MHIEIDYCPTSKRKHYFISVSLNEKEAISFDHTIKGHRVVKQVLIKTVTHEKNEVITAEWDTLIIKDQKFIEKYHVKWVDHGKLDIVNGEVWKTVWVKKLDTATDERLLYYSRLVSDNYENLNKFSKEMENFERLLSKEIAKHK